MDELLFVVYVWLTLVGWVDVVYVFIVFSVYTKGFIEPTAYVVFLTIHEDAFVEKAYSLELLLVHEKTGA